MKNFLNELKKQKLTIGIIVSIIFLASIGFTYAYFTAGILEQNVHDEIVTTGTLKLLYVDGPYIEAKNFYPGMAVEKEFVVSNIGTYDAEYSIN